MEAGSVRHTASAEDAWAIAPRARELAARTEAERRLPPELVEEIAGAGLFRMLVPAELGGGEAPPAELIEAVVALADGDGSAGWCLAVAATSGMLGAYLPADAAREVYGDERSVAGGVFAPKGRAVVQGDGSLVASGRWAFASGCEHCDWLMGGCLVEEGGELRKLESGVPDIRLLLFPREDFEISDTWNVAGLRGTGSHDFAVEGATVPADRSASLISDAPRVESPLYAFPVFGLLALAISAVGIGIARGAIHELVDLAGGKQPSGSSRKLAERSDTQSRIALAQAKVRSARAYVDEAVGEAWTAASAGDEIPVEQKAALRLAASHAIRASAEATDAAYELGGGSSIYESSPLQRRFRDVHLATQHMLVGPATLELAGRVLLGVETDTSQL